VTARNLKGVTIKDALDAIHKQFKKRVRTDTRPVAVNLPKVSMLTPLPQADDELADPYLAGFEWDKEESWTRLIVHLQKQPSTGGPVGGASKKKKKNKEEE
jgi:hypothetical protein